MVYHSNSVFTFLMFWPFVDKSHCILWGTSSLFWLPFCRHSLLIVFVVPINDFGWIMKVYCLFMYHLTHFTSQIFFSLLLDVRKNETGIVKDAQKWSQYIITFKISFSFTFSSVIQSETYITECNLKSHP